MSIVYNYKYKQSDGNYRGVCILGQVENQKNWILKKSQLDPLDAHKIKTFLLK